MFLCKFLELWVQAVAAAGTVGAVFVALWFGSRDAISRAAEKKAMLFVVGDAFRDELMMADAVAGKVCDAMSHISSLPGKEQIGAGFLGEMKSTVDELSLPFINEYIDAVKYFPPQSARHIGRAISAVRSIRYHAEGVLRSPQTGPQAKKIVTFVIEERKKITEAANFANSLH